MVRKAILINDVGTEKNRMQATKKDVFNFKRFLKSNTGGAWLDSEIYEIYNNTDIINSIHRITNNCDYTITMVSSHGCISESNNKLYVEINGEDYQEICFQNNSKRQLIIFDCCRTYSKIINVPKLKTFSVDSYKLNISKLYREVYNSYIEESDMGIITLYSCEPGYASSMNGDGSFFINSLIDAADYYKNKKEILYINEALKLSKELIKKYNKLQTPEMQQIKMKNFFPFAIYINQSQFTEYMN